MLFSQFPRLGKYKFLQAQRDILAYKTYRGQRRKDTLPEFFSIYVSQFKGSNADKEYPIIRIRDAIYPFVQSLDIIMCAILTQEIPILQVFGTLFIGLDVLKGANKDGLSAEKLKQNPSATVMMLDNLLDYGYPLITQKHVLESIIKPSGIMEKIEEAIIGRQNVQKENQSLIDKYIESQADVRENSQFKLSEIKGDEEVLFDVIEYLDCVLDKNGNPLLEEINGEIKVDCNLSGYPELYVFLSQPQPFNDYSVHECLINKLDTYEREKVLTFTPPSGTSTIFYYNLKNIQARVPFDLIPKITFTKTSARIELKISSRPVRGQSYVVEEFHIKLYLPNGLTLGETELQQGQIQQQENALTWRIGKLEIDQQIRFVVNYNTNDQFQGNIQQGNFLVCLKFFVNLYSPSQTKIDKVEVRNGAKVLTKKARNVAKSGYYEIRLN